MKRHATWSGLGESDRPRTSWTVQPRDLRQGCLRHRNTFLPSSFRFDPHMTATGAVPTEMTFAAPSKRLDLDASDAIALRAGRILDVVTTVRWDVPSGISRITGVGHALRSVMQLMLPIPLVFTTSGDEVRASLRV
jgi:hypothetical protein